MRPGQNVMAQRNNQQGTSEIVIGIHNDDAQTMWNIVIHSTGDITGTFRDRDGSHGETFRLGKLFTAGQVEWHEPERI